MNIIKKLVATVLVVLVAFCVIGCHPKDEIAVTIDGHKYTSAYYMCALVNAYMEGQQEVYNTLSEEEANSEKGIDFFSKKIGDKPFADWVKDRAFEMLKEVSLYKSRCRDNKLELTEEQISNSEYYASFYWSSYGYSTIFEPNGVSQETYKKYMVDTSYAELYFEHLYGEKGEKAVKAADIKKKLYSDFQLANILEVTFQEETDEEKKEIGKKFEKYAEQLDSGKKTFEQVYADYNKEEDHNHEEEKDGPKDPHATVIGTEGTGYEHDYYNEIKKMKTGEVKLIEDEEGTGYCLVVKQNIKADKYYIKDMDMTIRHLLKDTEYYEEQNKAAKELKPEINDYAVKRFKVKNIVTPQ